MTIVFVIHFVYGKDLYGKRSGKVQIERVIKFHKD